jgi:MFS family permease
MRPVIAGLMLVPYALAFLSSSLSAARVVTAYGTRCMTAAAALQSAALAGLAGAVFADYPHLGWPLFALLFAALGFGQGLLVSPLFRIVLSRIPPHLAGAGTGVLTTAQQSSIAIGVALIGTLFTTLLADLGYARATAIVLAIQALISIGVALGTLLLPRAADAPEALPVRAPETSAGVRTQAEVPGELA